MAGKSGKNVVRVGLDEAEPPADPGELSEVEGSEPALDSPGDEGILEQEEQYEGISSDRSPSEKQRTGRDGLDTTE